MSAEDQKEGEKLAGEEPVGEEAAAEESAGAGPARARRTSRRAKSEKSKESAKAGAEDPQSEQATKTQRAPGKGRARAVSKSPAAPGSPSEDQPAPKESSAKAPQRSKPAGGAGAGSKASPAVRPRRGARAPSRKVVRAHARYVRTSARKARMVCGHLRGKSVAEARAILAFTTRDVARDWSKLLESAVANAESNHELLEDDLIVREAYADEGPTIKRFRPRAMGRATPIRKRTSHLTITLTPRP
jgi:ribosomal protein L22